MVYNIQFTCIVYWTVHVQSRCKCTARGTVLLHCTQWYTRVRSQGHGAHVMYTVSLRIYATVHKECVLHVHNTYVVNTACAKDMCSFRCIALNVAQCTCRVRCKCTNIWKTSHVKLHWKCNCLYFWIPCFTATVEWNHRFRRREATSCTDAFHFFWCTWADFSAVRSASQHLWDHPRAFCLHWEPTAVHYKSGLDSGTQLLSKVHRHFLRSVSARCTENTVHGTIKIISAQVLIKVDALNISLIFKVLAQQCMKLATFWVSKTVPWGKFWDTAHFTHNNAPIAIMVHTRCSLRVKNFPQRHIFHTKCVRTVKNG